MQTGNKTKNSIRNTLFGFILKIIQLIIQFATRTVIIKVLGMEYAGLNSLFTSILSVLNLAEMGVGFALVYSMYKPIAENDATKICALMKLYRFYYRIIGIVILVVGLALTPFIPKLITGNVPADINLYILYFINLGVTVLSYWLFAYKNSLFSAHQRNDVISKVTIITDILKCGVQILLIFVLKNYYAFIIVALFMQIATNVLSAIIATKMFPDYKPQGDLDKEEKKKINNSIKDLFFSQFGMVVTLSVDSIVISAFLGLVPLAIYQNYYYILHTLIGFFSIFFTSMRASIGTNLIKKSKEENYKDFKFISFVVFGALTFSVSCLISLYQPFITLWVGEENLLDYWCVLLFGIYLFVYECFCLLDSYKSATGNWHADRFRPLITALVNLGLNILLVNLIGIYGILISTIVAFIMINIPWIFKRLFIDCFDHSFEKNYCIYFILKIIMSIIIIAICVFTCFWISFDNLLLELFVRLIVCSVLSLGLYLLVNIKDNSIKRLSSLKRIFKKMR